MQVFYKFLFLASLLALVAAAPAVSLEDGTSLTLQHRVLPLMPAGCMATAVTPVANGCVDRRDSDSAFTPDACF